MWFLFQTWLESLPTQLGLEMQFKLTLDFFSSVQREEALKQKKELSLEVANLRGELGKGPFLHTLDTQPLPPTASAPCPPHLRMMLAHTHKDRPTAIQNLELLVPGAALREFHTGILFIHLWALVSNAFSGRNIQI